MIPLIGFAPDLDPTTPGVLVDVTNIVPTKRGFAAGPGFDTAGAIVDYPAYPETSISTASLFGMFSTALADPSNLDIQYTTVLASRNLIRQMRYLVTSNTYATCSSTINLTGLVSEAWHFAEYNGAIYAAYGDTRALSGPKILANSGSSSLLGTIAAAPVASVIVSCSDFLVALNTGTHSNGWYCSALFDTTDWTPSLSTQCAKGRIIDGDGPFTAGIRFNNEILAFKNRSMHIGRYVGAPAVWNWTTISTTVGCLGKNAVCETPEGIFFVANDDFYIYDGTRAVSVGGPVREWFRSRRADKTQTTGVQAAVHFVICRYWEDKQQIWVMYPNLDATSTRITYSDALVLNMQTKKWGKFNFDSSHLPLWVDLIYPSSVWFPQDQASVQAERNKQMAYMNATDRKLYFLDATAGTASFTTGDWGDDDTDTFCDRLSVRYLDSPDSSTCTGYYKGAEGDALTTAGTANAFTNGHYDMRQTSNFHRFKVTTVGDMEVTALRPRLKKAGTT